MYYSLSFPLSLSLLCHRSNESDREARVRYGRQSNQESLDHLDVPCLTIPQFPAVWIKIKTFDSSVQEA